MGLYNRENNNRHKNAKKISFFSSTTAENEENHPKHPMMMGIMILILGIIILLSMKKKVKISMTNPLQQGKQQPRPKTLKKSSFFPRPPRKMKKTTQNIQ